MSDPQIFRQAQQLHQSGRLAEAMALYQQVLGQEPGNLDAKHLYGLALAQQGRFDLAVALMGQAIQAAPDRADFRYNIAPALLRLGRAAEAEAHLRAALALRPDWPDGLYALGRLLYRGDRYDEAEPLLRRLLEPLPDHAEGLTALGLLFMNSRRPAEAEPLLRRALALRPDNADARCNLGQLLLSLGRFEEGWPLNEARLAQSKELPAFPCPPWRGEPLTGNAILIWAEQGMGDMLMFARYLPLLKQLGAARVTLCCHPPLVPLLSGLEGVDLVLPQLQGQQAMPVQDLWALPLSLPFLTRTLLGTVPYLQAQPGRWAERLPPGFKVGLVWKGNPTFANDRHRSLPHLSLLQPLLDLPNITFVSLQKGQGEDELAGTAVLNLGGELTDFADTAALVTALDLVISVDTAVAHLAGALGKPVWLLLPARATDWRWLRGQENSPWYPGVMRLFHQDQPGDWSGVVARLLSALPVPTPE